MNNFLEISYIFVIFRAPTTVKPTPEIIVTKEEDGYEYTTPKKAFPTTAKPVITTTKKVIITTTR